MSQYNGPDEPTRQYGYQQQPGGYAQQPGGYAPQGQPQHQNPFGTEGNEQFGIASMVCSLLGAILTIVCLTSLQWFSVDGGSRSFSDIGDYSTIAGFAKAYFGWFAWTFLIISTISAVAASFPSPALRALRVLGVVAAFATAGLSFLAVQVNTARSYVDWLGDARIGFYLAIAGFIVIGVGAAIGPRKV